jgi:hypothetical protein
MNARWSDRAPSVGDTAELTRTVTARDIELFTEISGARTPLHNDPDAAAASRFGEIVVQGGITSAILNAVVAERLPGPGTVFLNTRFDFTAPVRRHHHRQGGDHRGPPRQADHHAEGRRHSRRRHGGAVRQRGVLHDAPGEMTRDLEK